MLCPPINYNDKLATTNSINSQIKAQNLEQRKRHYLFVFFIFLSQNIEIKKIFAQP